jgi:hypothetical protein
MPLTDAHIYVGNVSNIATDVAMTGVIGIDNTGLTTFAAPILVADIEVLATDRAMVTDINGVIDVSLTTAQEIEYVNGVTSAIQTQLDAKQTTTLADTNILVGNAGNLAAAVAMSADATMANTGALTIANSAVTVAKCSRFVTAEATGTITQAQLLDLFNTPVELIAAPGAGLYVVVEEMEVLHTYSTAVYINGGILQVEYGDGTDIISYPASVVTNGASASYFGVPGGYQRSGSAGTGGIDLTTAINSNVRLANLVGVFLNGNVANILKYRIRYHVATAQT